MDKSILKTEFKQGAVTSVDLLQQDQKSSAASSDEERLAADISTIGLKAGRLSGGAVEKTYKSKEDEGGDLDGK
jgi:hypothetical protein